MAFEIISTGRAIPGRRVSNDDLAQKIDTSDEWIRSHTGIGARHFAEKECAASDLALEAAKNALAMAAGVWGVDEESAVRSINLILVATATADYIGCPSTACIVQDKLGAKQAAAMDISAACTGFIYGLETAAGLLSMSGERQRALLIGTEVFSKFIDWTDRGSCVLFGDGAGAAVLEKTDVPREGPGKRGLIRTILGADGSGAENLVF
ncbi:MAG: 3-oxoacyl-ACP synthase, partial [Treponema sp.]|nr:3-oxoacyl-ACP synthase [Treponema sp.]